MKEAQRVQKLFKKLILFVFLLDSYGLFAGTPSNLLEIECDQFDTPSECETRRINQF